MALSIQIFSKGFKYMSVKVYSASLATLYPRSFKILRSSFQIVTSVGMMDEQFSKIFLISW